MPDAFPAIQHVAVTVRDLGVSVPWYQALIGSDPVMNEDTGPFHHTVFLMSGTLLGLHQFPDAVKGSEFNERQVGLDHIAFGCANRAELVKWEARLNELGVKNGGVVDAPYGSGLSFRDPDGIALEFFAPGG